MSSIVMSIVVRENPSTQQFASSFRVHYATEYMAYKRKLPNDCA